MMVIGKAVEGVDDFIDKLEATHAFSNMSPTTERITDQGYSEVSIVGDYEPSAAVVSEKEDKEKPPAEPGDEAPADKPVTPAKPATAAATNPTTPPQPASTSAGTRAAKPGTAPRGVS
jgi:hypothetical protein